MKKAVLISIRPKWCELIANGKKTIEVRKTRPKLGTPFKCYIYATKQGRPLVYGSPVPTYVDDNLVQTYGYSKEDAERIFGTWNGKVIGEFVCDKVESRPFGNGIAAYYSNEVGTCLSDVELRLYVTAGKPLYFWHISDLIIYDEQKELSEFRHCGRNYHFNPIITKPPQSWCYVEEVGFDA